MHVLGGTKTARKLKGIVLAGLVVGAVILPAGPASACQSDSPCPCSEEPTRTINNVWNGLTGRELIACTF